jgi:hypothetical protein
MAITNEPRSISERFHVRNDIDRHTNLRNLRNALIPAYECGLIASVEKDPSIDFSTRYFLAYVEGNPSVWAMSDEDIQNLRDHVVQTIWVVYALKRQALIRMGDLACLVDQYGRVQYSEPDIEKPSVDHILYAPIHEHIIARASGGVPDGANGSRTIYRYA